MIRNINRLLGVKRVKGYINWSSKPGLYADSSQRCAVCGTGMSVRRSMVGPASFAEGMAGLKHEHDSWGRPRYDEDWHAHALHLCLERDTLVSERLRVLVQTEINEVLAAVGIDQLVAGEQRCK